MIMKYELYMDKLNEEYLNACKKVREYALGNGIGGKYLGERMMDLMDLLLEAQKQKIDCEKITGNDMETFCQIFFQDYGSMDRWRGFLHGLTSCCWMFFLIGLYYINFSEWNHIFQGVTLNLLWSFILGIGIASIADAVIILFNMNNMNRKKRYIIKIIVQMISIIIVVLWVLENNLPIFLLFLVSSIYLLIYYSTSFALCYLETGSFRRKSSDYTIWFGEILKEEWNKEFNLYSRTTLFAQTLAERFEKINHKRKKKGKAEWGTDTFFCYMQKEWKYSGIVLFFSLVLVVLGLTSWIADSTDMIDTVIFFLICTFVEGVWLLLCQKMMKKILARYEELHRSCSEVGMSLLEYVGSLRKE